tara:strand:- start:12121 stop:13176 length:1056 start_codon:yes stop_codon:yes gene_type:complete
MKILYVGNLNYGNTCYSRYRGFVRNGFNVSKINTIDFKVLNNHFERFLPKNKRFHFDRLNNEILHQAKKNIDFVFFDQPFYLSYETIYKIKNEINSKIIFHFTDDIEYLDHGLYLGKKIFNAADFIFTCNKYSIQFLKSIGCKKVYYNELGYDDEYIKLNIKRKFTSDKVSIGFIGHYEMQYYRSIEEIYNSVKINNELSKQKISLEVFGSGWFRKFLFTKKYVKKPDFFNKDYGGITHEKYWKLINSFDIGLGLFSSINRNQTSARTFEIPASNSLLLTKESPIINKIFKHQETAIFWDEENIDNLIKNVFNDKEFMSKICKNGHEFIRDNNFKWLDRINEIIDIIQYQK